MTRVSRPALAFVVVLAFAGGPARAAEPTCDRVIAIGDLHGGYDAFVAILRATGLVDETLRLVDGRACLVQTGDVVDRGAESRKILDLLMALDAQAPDRVEMVLGNHEAMTITGDLRYVSPEEIAAFAAEETADERAAAFEAFVRPGASGPPPGGATQAEFDRLFPAGWFARRRAFGAEGHYGRWLLERPAVVQIDGSVILHGGLTPAVAGQGIDAIAAAVPRELREFLAARAALEDAGWLRPTDDYAAAYAAVEARSAAAPTDDAARPAAAAFLALKRASFVDPEGPLWYRGLAQVDEKVLEPDAFAALAPLGAERIVVAHTPTADQRISRRCGGHVFAIDTGAGPAYGGRASALEIAADGTVDAVYVDGRERLVDRPLTDPEWETALLEGEIVGIEEIGIGITRPRRVTLRHGGRTLRAAFKTVDIQETELTRFASSGGQFQFTDSYRFERPAYLLDRKLGMRMVPPTVEREIEGEKGSLVAWIDKAINELERRERDLTSPDPIDLAQEQQIMRVFDALILNADRNLGNQLITPWDFRLHLIDHTRAFGLTKTLAEPFEKEAVGLPGWLFDAIRGLDAKETAELFRGMVSGTRLKAMFARRDALVKKIEHDVQAYGATLVFHDAAPAR